MGRIITKPFDYDPFTDTTEIFHFDTETEEVTIETVQGSKSRKGAIDVIAESNKAMFNSFDERSRWKDGVGDMVARIPLVILQQHPELLYDNKALKKWLNDPDNRIFRTRPGRI